MKEEEFKECRGIDRRWGMDRRLRDERKVERWKEGRGMAGK